MPTISMIEHLVKDSFHVLNGMPDYITLHEKERMSFEGKNLKAAIENLISLARESDIKRIGVLINRETEHYFNLSTILLNYGFEKYASKVEVFRDLQDIKHNIAGYEWRSLSDATISEDEFKRLWKKCMSGSDNAPTSLSME